MKAIVLTVLVLVGHTLAASTNHDEYTKQAIDELKHMQTSRFLTLNVQPKCTEEDNSIECCISFKLTGKFRKICIKVTLSPKKSDASFDLVFDGQLVFSRDLQVGQVCAPLPNKLKALKSCVDVYYVNLDTKPPALSFECCFTIKMAGIMKLKPNCIRLDKDGILSQHS
uniref:Heteropteran venom family 2 protein 2 n=1 Tax=Oncocephalus sp. TaxID=2944721 RepID=A0AB38ZEI6_9HEMI